MRYDFLAFALSFLVASAAMSVSSDAVPSPKEKNMAVAASAAPDCLVGQVFCGWYLRDHCMSL